MEHSVKVAPARCWCVCIKKNVFCVILRVYKGYLGCFSFPSRLKIGLIRALSIHTRSIWNCVLKLSLIHRSETLWALRGGQEQLGVWGVDSASSQTMVSMETPTSSHTFRGPTPRLLFDADKTITFLVCLIQTTNQSAAKLTPRCPLSTRCFCPVLVLDQIYDRRKPTTTATSSRCTPLKRSPPVVFVTFCSGNIHSVCTFFFPPNDNKPLNDWTVSDTLMQSRNINNILSPLSTK